MLVLFLAGGATGCSSFGRVWRDSAGIPPGPHGIAGRWDGEWVSDVNGHHGRLRAVATSLGEARVHIRYRATYKKLLRFGYEMGMEVRSTGKGACVFEGAADLGVWGDYRCEGSANGTNFTARYETRYDRGTFTLYRVGD